MLPTDSSEPVNPTMTTAADYETHIRPYVAKLEDENARLREALHVGAESCERDRREPDKILCHVLTMRREAQR